MIWRVEYNKDDEFEKKSDVVEAFEVSEGEYLTEPREHDMWTVYDIIHKYYVYVNALGKTEALVKAQRIFKEYFELLAKRAEECASLKIDELKEFAVDEEVKIINPGQQFDTHYIAFGGLMGKAFENGYRGPFVLGEYVSEYPATTRFTVIAKGIFDANGQKDMTLYMVAEALEAYKHRSERGAKRSKEPLKAFVLTGTGLESWWR